MQTITLKIINEEVLAILQKLEKLELLEFVKEPQIEAKEENGQSLAGTLSSESADLLMEHTKEVRNEWERKF